MLQSQTWFLITLAGLLVTLAGLIWDAVIHSQGHAHLVTEALLNPGNPFANPGHVVFGIGLAVTTIATLAGFTDTWLEQRTYDARWGALAVPVALWLAMGLAGFITLIALSQT